MQSEADLRANSRLPGPRANLELLGAAAEQVDRETAFSWGRRPVGDDPTDVFVVMVGLAGLGKFLAGEGDDGEAAALLRERANDAGWRVREAVAIALQRLGDEQPDMLADMARDWVTGTTLEARAAVAGVAEPGCCATVRLFPSRSTYWTPRPRRSPRLRPRRPNRTLGCFARHSVMRGALSLRQTRAQAGRASSAGLPHRTPTWSGSSPRTSRRTGSSV